MVQVTSGAPGQKAGLRPGDVIYRRPGDPVGRGYSTCILPRGAIGKTLEVEVLRDGAKFATVLAVEARPAALG